MTIRTTGSLEVKDKGTGTVETTGAVHPRATSEALQETEEEGAGSLQPEKIHVVETEGIGKHSVICSLN
jgi:hypothetical protein